MIECEWKYMNDYTETRQKCIYSTSWWETTCKKAHSFITGTPEENRYRFCPYCGKKLVIKKEEDSIETNLGTMNNWNETPPEFKACKEAGHELEVENLGRCYNEYTCEICKIRYRVDSSD